MVGYCIMGAFIFQEVEKYNELETKRQMRDKRLAMTDTLWEITKYVAKYSFPLIFFSFAFLFQPNIFA